MTLARLMRLGLAAGSATIVAGCVDSFAPPEGLPLATAIPACGSGDDQPVMIILLSPQTMSPDPPHVWISIVGRREEGKSWALTGSGAQGSARYHSSAAVFEDATSGGVMIDKIDEGESVEGAVNLVFPTKGWIRGDFDAQWVPSNEFCL